MIMVRLVRESANNGLTGYAVVYRDMASGYQHLLMFANKAEALDAYNELDTLSDQLDNNEIDISDYHYAIEDITNTTEDMAFEIDFRNDIDSNNIYTEPYGTNRKWQIVNPVAVDLYMFESLTEATKKSKKCTGKVIKETPELVKTTIRTARKLFDAGKTVYILPNKVRLGNPWILPFAVNKNSSQGHSLENILDSYSYYNCNKETGNGIAFYKEAE